MRRPAAGMLLATLIWALATAAFAALFLGSPDPAAACSCATFTDAEAIELADAVFTGTLAEIVTPDGDTYRSDDPERFVFDVDAVFKGEVFAHQSIITAREGSSCGLEISGPGPFVVFARLESDGITEGALAGELYSNLCSGTRSLADGAVRASFGVASPPIQGPAGDDDGDVGDDDDTRGWATAVAIAGTVTIVGAIGAWRYRRRRHGSTAVGSDTPSSSG